ncbi:ankyrin [Lindgomyces ingoldianus]|uniref:Ankyrin n=1 Tax=Lindgomyces ingoldianus TaxID=673940 RepID=A0ACB6QYB4_9PLEO|nr:ankyrin [Lindgomyces ingoldianus]KAF2471881.1 ankyrin [Lindgomyces ingoldianus]
MQLLDLPLVLVQDIIEQAVNISKLHEIARLCQVNRLFNREGYKYLARNRLGVVPYWDYLSPPIPQHIKLQLVREYIGDWDRGKNDFASHVHAVVDELVRRFSQLPPDGSQSRSREDILDDVCEAIIRSGYHRRLFGQEIKQCARWDNRFTRSHRKGFPYKPKAKPNRNPNTPERIGRSTIMIAVIMRYTTLLEAMLKGISQPRLPIGHGDGLDWRSPCFGSPIESAIEMGHHIVLLVLLEAGATFPANCWPGRSLCRAAMKGHTEVFRVLLERPSNELLQRDFQVALERAVRRGQFELAEMISKKRGLPCSLLSPAVKYGRADIVREVASERNIAYWRTSFSLLRLAVEKGHFEVAKVLVERGAGKDIKTRRVTSYHVIKGGNVAIMELLMSHGMELVPDQQQWMLAVEGGHTEMAKFLSDRGFDRCSQTPELQWAFALLMSIVRNHAEMVCWLICDRSVDPSGHHKLRSEGLAPLVVAVDSGHADMVALVKQLGGRATAKELAEENFEESKRCSRRLRIQNDKFRVRETFGVFIRHSKTLWEVPTRAFSSRALEAAKDALSDVARDPLPDILERVGTLKLEAAEK